MAKTVPLDAFAEIMRMRAWLGSLNDDSLAKWCHGLPKMLGAGIVRRVVFQGLLACRYDVDLCAIHEMTRADSRSGKVRQRAATPTVETIPFVLQREVMQYLELDDLLEVDETSRALLRVSRDSKALHTLVVPDEWPVDDEAPPEGAGPKPVTMFLRDVNDRPEGAFMRFSGIKKLDIRGTSYQVAECSHLFKRLSSLKINAPEIEVVRPHRRHPSRDVFLVGSAIGRLRAAASHFNP